MPHGGMPDSLVISFEVGPNWRATMDLLSYLL